jgi:hypothetical protein
VRETKCPLLLLLLSHTFLLGKLSSFGLTSAYVSWFRSYLTDRFSCVKISGIFSAPFRILAGVPQGSVLWPLLFNIYIDDICNVITHSKFLLFADDIQMFRAIKSFDDFTQLQLDIDSIRWCTANLMNLNISKTRAITLSRETNTPLLKYKLGDSYITRTDYIKDLGVFIDSKLYVHSHVDGIFSQSIKLLGLIRNIIFSFSTLDSLLILYVSLVRPKLQYASVVWNSITSTDAKKLERIQRKFVALCYNRFLSRGSNGYSYANALQVLNLRTLHDRRHQLDATFVTNVFLGSKSCPSTIDIIGLRVPTRNLRDIPLFHVSSSYTNCPSGRCATVANSVYNHLDVFRRQIVTLSQM